MSRRNELIANALLFQAGWWLCVLASLVVSVSYTMLMLLFFHRRYGRQESISVLIFALSGLLIDLAAVRLGAIELSGGFPWFLLCLWLLFAMTLDYSLSFFTCEWRRLPAPAALAPLAYLGGETFGALSYGENRLTCILGHAFLWLVWLSFWKWKNPSYKQKKELKMAGKSLLLIIFLWLVSCSSVDIESYSGRGPAADPAEFFDGRLEVHGIVKNRSGEVIRTFTADILATWDGAVGTLNENFIFDDGEKQQRIWTLTKLPDGSFSGTAGDVVGVASGRTAGNAMFLKYTLRIKYDGSDLDIDIDDRMYLVDDRTLINESRMLKFGFEVGEIVLVIRKLE